MKKTNPLAILGLVIILAGMLGGLFLIFSNQSKIQPAETTNQNSPIKSADLSQDILNASYEINGQPITLVGGKAGSISYFGNSAAGDLNGDGVLDQAFILTDSPGGSGTFYYVAVALKTPTGYLGTNAVLLGDRIAPQTTEIREGYLIVNYAQREAGQAMTERPAVGVSKYLAVADSKLVETLRPAVFNQSVTLQVNQGVVYPDGLVVTLEEINDSRCPIDVQCIWAGELSALLVVQFGKVGQPAAEVRMGTANNTTVNLENYSFALVSATATGIALIVGN